MNTDNHTLLVVPFVGSGSECVAGKNLGIDVIGYEVNEVYVELARSRLA
jgi:DNA modification methylase